MSNERPSIDVSPNGPYLVAGLENFKNSKGENIESKKVIALCRCGASQNKPFCDGSHSKVGFDDRRIRKIKYQTKEFEGKDLTVVDNVGACSHAGYCVRGAPNVFFKWDNDERRSTPDEGETENTVQTIRKCPSGSLTYKLGGKHETDYFDEPVIVVSKDGPLYVRGACEFNDTTGAKPHIKEHYALCRCGSSKNKPFCDGAHKKVGFKDTKN